MRNIISFVLVILLFFSCKNDNQNNTPLTEIHPTITNFPLQNSVRAIEVIDEQTVWFAGSKGQFGYTENNGDSWYIDSIKIENLSLEFRSIAITDSAVFILSVASPALLLKSTDKGKNWDIVYRENHEAAFYDAMDFWDNQNGIAMGDPTDGCLSVIITNDGGNHWKKLSCETLPAAVEGEAAFAASNTNISLQDDHVWIVSGGAKARVFHSADKGKSWEVFNTPISQGGKMTGIFSSDFYDSKKGIIWGGDWEKQEQNTNNKAVTNDGGKTWNLINDGQDPGYRSCVQFIPNTDGNGLIAVGIPGISYSTDFGNNWTAISDSSYYTIRMPNTGNTAWLAGNKVIAKMTW